MTLNTDILQKTSAYVSAILHEKLADTFFYHNYGHTSDVVNNVAEISNALKIEGDDLEIVLIAAWFHDTGYVESTKAHEAHSIKIAKIFLAKHNYPADRTKKIIGCIKATKVPQNPKNILEKIVCDSDLLYLGQKDCIERAELLRLEFEQNFKRNIPETEWLTQSVEFFHQHHFHTDFVIKKYGPKKEKNMQGLLKALLKLGLPFIKKQQKNKTSKVLA
jgi:predicted metal-dependent HD superfamily phosphohydrolase